MIDDLVSQTHTEPYRMLTSRAEYRLILRSETADERMSILPETTHLIDASRRDQVATETADILQIQEILGRTWLGANDRHAVAFQIQGIEAPARSMTAMDIARRPGVTIRCVISALKQLEMWTLPEFPNLTLDRAEIAVKYGSFIEKERNEAARHIKNEHHIVPDSVDFTSINGMRTEAAQKLSSNRPTTIGHAIRTAGVTPSDIGALLVHLSRHYQHPAQKPAKGAIS